MEIIIIENDSITTESFTDSKKYLKKMRQETIKYLRTVFQNNEITIDMDGVLAYDDGTLLLCQVVDQNKKAEEMFHRYAELNIKAVQKGLTSYCWYAPALFTSQLLSGLSPEISKIIGQHIRLIPDANEYVDIMSLKLGFKLIIVTAGIQETAEVVSQRLNLSLTFATKLVIVNNLYNNDIGRFIGGKHKLELVKNLLTNYQLSTHIGDSWSDLDTLDGLKNSVAFNPGCLAALNSARISVVGTSLLTLLPLFDQYGVYDNKLKNYQLPLKVIIRKETIDSNRLIPLMAKITDIKKVEIKALVDAKRSEENVLSSIISELRKQKIPYNTNLKNFMSPNDFDIFAKNRYQNTFG